MRSAKFAAARAQFHIQICLGAAPDLCGRERTVYSARMLVDLARRSWHASLQPAVTKRIWHGYAQQSMSDSATPRAAWQAGLQLEVAKPIVTAAEE